MTYRLQFGKLTELSAALLKELAVTPQTHCRLVLAKSLIFVLAILSLASGIFVSIFMVCQQLSDDDSISSNRPRYCQIGVIASNLFTCSIIIADFVYSFKYRNLLQTIPTRDQTTFYLMFLPFSMFPIFLELLNALTQFPLNTSINSQIEVIWDISLICFRVLSVVFLVSARRSCDTGENLKQTLLRYAAIVHTITSMISLGFFELSLGQVHIFIRVIFANETIGNIPSNTPLYLLYDKFSSYGIQLIILSNIVGIVFLLEPLRIQWILLQQRLLSVTEVSSEQPDQTNNAPQFDNWFKWETVHWFCSILLIGFLIISHITFMLNSKYLHPIVAAEFAALFAATVTTSYYLYRLQERMSRHHYTSPGPRSYMWLSTDDVIISIGLLSYMVSAISDLQIGMECHVGVTNCTDRFNDYLYPVSASFELLHGISQGMLLLTFTEIDKTLWAILPDNSTIGKLLSPLHYLVILNAFYVIYGIFPFNKLRFMLGDKSILTQLYRETDHVLALSGYILFRLHSAYVIVKFYFT